MRDHFRAFVLAILMKTIGYDRAVRWGVRRRWIAEHGDGYVKLAK